jgi:hypothetical protein
MSVPSPFDRFNLTELYQTARDAGLVVLPNESRENIIAYLLGEKEPPPIEHDIDMWRNGIMGFLIEHWKQVETQLTCPAKSKDPRACFGCVDTQVVNCLISNETDLHQIRLHRKP